MISSKITQSLMRSQRFFSTFPSMNANVAVVFSGCGCYDGTEIHEASSLLFHLSREKTNVAVFAPDSNQMHVVDHLKGQPNESESRNVLVESARIARGQIQSISKLSPSIFDALIFPGGFGVAKNLCTFASDGSKMKVNKDVEKFITEFHKNKKPIGFCCIAPVLAAKLIKGCEVTLGHDKPNDELWPHSGACQAVKEMGAKHVDVDVNKAHVDKANLVVTTPAFMGNAPLFHVYDGIGHLVKEILKLIQK